ncbi:EXLDI protein [Nocardia panacis]|uniref:EXLDI protein n=1 Tax=Nocardia panacis TaxID=2340916 RepID=UPI00131571D2|nr:EXLDI protein [Nocardia panacis]
MTIDPNTTEAAPSTELELAGAGEFHEIVLRVGPGGGRRQRFDGRLIGEARQYSKLGLDVVRVYVSRKGKFVVHRQEAQWREITRSVDWQRWSTWSDLLGTGAGHQGWGDYTIEIFDSVEDLHGRVPERIYRTVVDVANDHGTLDLEI